MNIGLQGENLIDRIIPLVKVLWRSQEVEEETWEPEEEVRRNYPQLFQGTLGFEDETFLRRVEL